jgi:deoxyribodipyrimidine photo-lyase
VVVDQSPLRLGREWREAVAAAAECPVHEVDAHNVVPVWEASPKLEVGARTLRQGLTLVPISAQLEPFCPPHYPA